MTAFSIAKRLTGACLAVAAVFGFTACGAQTNANESQTTTTVTIGVNNAYKPFDYLNENGDLDGYEIAVLKAVDEALPEYRFEYKPLDFQNIIVSLDSGKVDVASCVFTVNAERKQKYNLTEPYHLYLPAYIYVSNNSKASINGIEDLAGKKVAATQGTDVANTLEEFNKNNPDKKIELVYANWSGEQLATALESGAVDATYSDPVSFDLGQLKGKAKKVGEPIQESETSFLVGKKNTEIAQAIDKGLQKISDDGTLSELSQKYLGDDYTKSAV